MKKNLQISVGGNGKSKAESTFIKESQKMVNNVGFIFKERSAKI